MQVITIENAKPIFSWCPNIEEEAQKQMVEISKLPYVKHCALMPDAHLGMSCPIGGVVACDSVIVPNFVGVDIACGMGTMRTNLTTEEIKGKEEIIHNAITRSIPMGFSHNQDKRRKEMQQKYEEKIEYNMKKFLPDGYTEIVKPDAFYDQMGTLGGGNHFLELQSDEEGHVWMMVHSGSRGIGKKVCDHFNDIAKKANEKWYSQSIVGFLPVTSEEGKQYIGWMNMCMMFAYYNRQAMLEEIKRNLLHYFPNMEITTKAIEGVGGEILNIHHNYASIENHMGQNWWVHRKGATLASDKTIGIIPGSMGSASYIVRGKGKKESLNSCSHGAGRRMGRNVFNQAYNTPDKLKEIEESMKNIKHTKFGRATSRKGKDLGMLDISEAPQAYKDIDEVINNELDLIVPIHKLTPLVNWKDSGEE